MIVENYDRIKELMSERAKCQEAIKEIKKTDYQEGTRVVLRDKDCNICHEEIANNKQNVTLFLFVIENLTKKYSDRIASIDEELKEL